MKFVLYKVRSKNRSSKFRTGFNTERVLFLSFLIIFCFTILVQAMLATPSMRTYMTEDKEYEGSPIKVEEYLYKEGEITLELQSGDFDQDLKVLKNGDLVAIFSDKRVKLSVKDGDVIEIDGTDSSHASQIAVASCSGNVSKDSVGRTVSVISNVKSLTKIKME